MVEDFDLPALDFGVVAVHFEQVAGEQRRLVAAGAGADFHDARASELASSPPTVMSKQLVPQRFAFVAQLRQLGLGQLAHSASSPSIICCASAIWPLSCLNWRYFLASLPSEPCSRATAVMRAGFDSTSGSMRSCSSSSKRASFCSSKSRMEVGAASRAANGRSESKVRRGSADATCDGILPRRRNSGYVAAELPLGSSRAERCRSYFLPRLRLA